MEPVLSATEAGGDPHLTARETYVSRDGMVQPSPAPRFSRTRAGYEPAPVPGQHTTEALTAWGLADAEDLVACGAARQA